MCPGYVEALDLLFRHQTESVKHKARKSNSKRTTPSPKSGPWLDVTSAKRYDVEPHRSSVPSYIRITDCRAVTQHLQEPRHEPNTMSFLPLVCSPVARFSQSQPLLLLVLKFLLKIKPWLYSSRTLLFVPRDKKPFVDT